MSEPILYILMRNDLDSLNPGKAMAHAAHAANQFQCDVERCHKKHPLWKMYQKWKGEYDFGVTVTLAAPMDVIEDRFGQIMHENNVFDSLMENPEEIYMKGFVHDPSYPIRDGQVTHLIPLDTCAYLFCNRKSTISSYLSSFPLHP